MSEPLFEGLNPQQRLAVRALEGPVLVLAGPGSGKTRVLTHRIANLIQHHGVDPLAILAVTFTNKAAREMRERLEALIGSAEAAAVNSGTFHSICARLLRREIMHLGRERDFVVYDSDDQERLMKRVLRDLNLDEKKNPPRAIHARISSAKNELVGPAEYARLNRREPFDQVVARCYERYQQLLRESNALDFDDLLVETVRLFDEHPAVLARYQARYRYLLVDEYQDTNRAQYLIVKHLAAAHHNLFAVGDEDQSVYGWRGADVRNIQSFEADYPEAQVILLEQNYRSTQAILDVASAVVGASRTRKRPKQLWTENGAGLQVALFEGYDQGEEARLVAEEINRLVASGEVRYGDCAIMYRTNAQSRAIEEALMARQVRYQIIGGTRFYERKEIKDTLAYLRLAHNPFDSVSLLRVLNYPARGIGQRSEEELIAFAKDLGLPLIEALRELAGGAASTINARARNTLIGFSELLSHLIATAQRESLPDLIRVILAKIELREALLREYGDEEGDERWSNLAELLGVAQEYANLPREHQLATFLEEVALVADVDKLDTNADAVTCITLHQAKGLEYPVVFLVGLEEGLLPHSRSIDDRERLEEERRLLYVGATRAKRRLYLLYAFRRTSWGRTEPSIPSRFLKDIPQNLLKRPSKRPSADASFSLPRQSELFTSRGSLNRTERSAAQPPVVRFAVGQRVRHASFGDGIVLATRPIEGDEEVTVRFFDRERRLLASFARLEPLGE